MNALSLFTGIGGLDVALSDYVRPVICCEIDTYCREVLFSRMADESLPNCPIWDDIRTLSGLPFNGSVDIIYAGFPCQDVSVAGYGKGLAGERSGLFFEILRLAKEIQPAFIFLENVPAITKRGGIDVVRSITEMGYDSRWCVISAASVGAIHKRERWFLLAYATSERFNKRSYKNIQFKSKKPQRQVINQLCWGKTESPLDRKAHGIPHQLDRIRSLGNAVVPAQAKKAFEILMGLWKQY